eukprot:4929682-Prorocentrum_lima.AAC.1
MGRIHVSVTILTVCKCVAKDMSFPRPWEATSGAEPAMLELPAGTETPRGAPTCLRYGTWD